MISKLKFYPVIVLTASLLALGLALAADYIFHIKPCLLCMYQRYGWALLTVLSSGALVISHRKWVALALGFSCLALTGLATYQVLIEEKYIEAPQACKSASVKATSTEALWASLEEKPLAPCDQVAFKWGGLSMAAYSGLLSTALAMLCFLAWFYHPRRSL